MPTGLVIYWSVTLALATGGLGFALLAWRLKKTWCTLAAVAVVAVTLASLSMPVQPAPSAVLLAFAVLAFGLAIAGGAPLVTLVLRLATRGSVPAGTHGGILVEMAPGTADRDGDGPRQSRPREVLRGGLTIGVLERLAVVGSIIAGFPAAIAVVVAVKGVGRFSELDAAEARERFIIGTFTSLIWACSCAAIVVLAGS